MDSSASRISRRRSRGGRWNRAGARLPRPRLQPRHPLPRKLPKVWLFSDVRTRADVITLAALLPPGSGVVLRHDSLTPGARWRLLRRLMRVASARGLTVLLAGMPATAARWGADGVHLRQHDARRAGQAIDLANQKRVRLATEHILL